MNISPTKLRAGAHFEVEVSGSKAHETWTVFWRPLDRLFPAQVTDAGVAALRSHLAHLSASVVTEAGIGWVKVLPKDAAPQQRAIAGILSAPGHTYAHHNHPPTGLSVHGQSQGGMPQ